MAAEDLVFRDETFDLVTCGDSLPYLVDPVRSLAEARRVLRPGGRIALSCQRRSLDTEAQETFFECLNALVARHPMRVPTHSSERVGFGEPEELTAMLAEAGFAEPRLTAMVTGGRVRSGASWIALMEDAGPFAHALIRTLGPALREQLARDLEEAMAPLGEEAFHYHFPFTFAVAERWG
jgi:SAM-dependent methyltransferase